MFWSVGFNLVRQVSAEGQVSRLASILDNGILVPAGYDLYHLLDLKQTNKTKQILFPSTSAAKRA